MIYRGTKDGFEGKYFHGKCDDQGKTFCILKTEAEEGGQVKISGWYTDIQWTSDRGYKEGSGNSFIFVLRDDMNLIKLRCKNKQREAYHDKDFLCCFGWKDIWIKSDCNIKYLSWSSLGDYCEKPSANERLFLAGSYSFKVLEMEVYKVL